MWSKFYCANRPAQLIIDANILKGFNQSIRIFVFISRDDLVPSHYPNQYSFTIKPKDPNNMHVFEWFIREILYLLYISVNDISKMLETLLMSWISFNPSMDE